MRSRAKSTPWLTLLFALLGLAWCGYVAFPTATPPPCATSGCALFRDTRVAGLSLWWVGGAYFFILAIVCLRGNRDLARLLSVLALFADAVLLLIMFLTAPCFDCLVVAALLGLGYYSLMGVSEGWFLSSAAPSILLPVWFGLFLGNAVLAANEMMPQHSIGLADNAELRIFFSPSCPACREALTAFGDKAVLYPVLEDDGDFDAVVKLEALLTAKVPMRQALDRSLDPAEAPPHMPLHRRMLMEIQLLRNKSALMRQGFRALPLIQINGMPGHRATSLERGSTLLRNGAENSAAQPAAPSPTAPPELPTLPGTPPPPLHNGESLPDFLQDMDTLKKCGGDNAAPCD